MTLKVNLNFQWINPLLKWRFLHNVYLLWAYYVTENDLKLLIILPLPLQCSEYTCVPPCLFLFFCGDGHQTQRSDACLENTISMELMANCQVPVSVWRNGAWEQQRQITQSQIVCLTWWLMLCWDGFSRLFSLHVLLCSRQCFVLLFFFLHCFVIDIIKTLWLKELDFFWRRFSLIVNFECFLDRSWVFWAKWEKLL